MPTKGVLGLLQIPSEATDKKMQEKKCTVDTHLELAKDIIKQDEDARFQQIICIVVKIFKNVNFSETEKVLK